MSTVEQSSLSIVETLAKAERSDKEVYVTTKGQVKVQEGLSGWWAGRKIKSGKVTRGEHHQRIVDQFKAAVARESRKQNEAIDSSRRNTLTRLANTLETNSPTAPRPTAAQLVNLREIFIRPQSNATELNQKIIADLKSGHYYETLPADTNSPSAKHRAALKIASDLQSLSDAELDLHQQIETQQALAPGNDVAAEQRRLNDLSQQLTTVRGSRVLLEHVADRLAAAAPGTSAPSSTIQQSGSAEPHAYRSIDAVIDNILTDDDGRLSSAEAKAGIRYQDLDPQKQAAFNELLRIYVDPEQQLTKDAFTLKVERDNNPGEEPTPTYWRGKDINDDAVKDILKFLSQPTVDETFLADAKRDEQEATAALARILQLGSQPLDTLSEENRAEFTQALSDYVSVVGGKGALQTYLRRGSEDDVPQAPEALKERLRNSLVANTDDTTRHQAFLAILANASLLNVVRSNIEQLADPGHDPYGLGATNSNVLHDVNPATRKLLIDLFENIAATIVPPGVANTVDDVDEVQDLLAIERVDHAGLQQGIDAVLATHSKEILTNLQEAARANYLAGLTDPGFHLDDTQRQNYEQLVLLNLALSGQFRAGHQPESVDASLVALGAPPSLLAGQRFTFTLPQAQKSEVASALTSQSLDSSESERPTSGKDPEARAALNTRILEQLRQQAGAGQPLTTDQAQLVAERLSDALNVAALQAERDALHRSALGFYGDRREGFEVVGGFGAPQVNLEIVDEQIKVQVAQFGELQALRLNTAPAATTSGERYRPDDAAGTPAGAVHTLSFSLDLETLRRGEVEINENTVSSVLDIWVPEDALYL